MPANLSFAVQWALVAFAIAFLVRLESGNKETLPSLKVKPSEIYTPDFYPGGTDLALPGGTMRYWLFGDPNGRKVVLIHGISTGAASYDSLARSLAKDGHRVLVFDLWGRGYSEAPPTVYNEMLYTSQVALLLQKVGWTRCDVVGVSLGGAIAASFTAHYPEIVDKLIFIAPAGLMTGKNDIPLTGRLMKLPLVAKMATHPMFRPLAVLGVNRFFKNSKVGDKSEAQAVKTSKIALHQFTHHPGFIRAFAGTVADYPLHNLTNRYKTVGQDPHRPVLLLWGDIDRTVPFENSELLLELIPHAKLSVYKNGGHDILQSHWERTNREVHEFLSS